MQLHNYKDSESLNTSFVEQLSSILQSAVQQRGHAYLAVSGGKTPQPLFQALAQKDDIPWEKITITLTDERFVHPAHTDSNERMVRESLLQNNAEKARFIGLWTENVKAQEAINSINQKLENIPMFDAVILGMGTDGHTASLFPCSREITRAALEEGAAMLIQPETAPYQRISLTRKRLLNARNIFLHIIGEGKYSVLMQALEGESPEEMPIRFFLHNSDKEVQVMYAPI